ncbi:cellulose biosynthesis cyclic di-GMP-binding regulatory protein BcsB [Acidithiobacillus thiooxidans]|uniref:cellulose biosynthesis cyclic di-GMP-binding regulatory protein BcsB n=1 Tax=Acidithiobacillus thiooxidans TaxID=930 RepID=UPI00242E8FF4|nr:cellulose biosynthesis cyclic di-GMP-binding regulatory protein BcsB [Acidithiobacillus thiooxidans]
MKRKYIAALCTTGIASLWLGVLPAVAQTQAVPVSLPLTALTQGKKVVVLHSGHDTAQVTWKVKPHCKAENASLQIRYLTSPDTTAGTQLIVSVAHKIVGAVPLNSRLPRGSFTVLLGHHPFSTGAYPIQIRAIPGDAASSAKATTAGAWTQLDYSASQIRYTPERIPWKHLNFTHLPMILSETALKGVLPLPVQFYGATNPGLLNAAQEAVAGLALRTNNSLHVDAQMGSPVRASAKGTNLGVSVVIGESSELPPGLQPQSPITAPTVYLMHDPANPLGVTLVFTGTNSAQVLEAARAFAINRKLLPLGHRWNVTGSDQITGMYFGPKNAAYPNQVISLGALQGIHSPLSHPHGTAVINFWMPGGLFASRQSNLKMKLTMATEPLHTPAIHPLITVMANHHWISNWKLTPGVANYQTTIPFSALVGGENHITFDIAGGKVTVFPNSTLELPNTHRYAVLPNLGLFAHTGFPLVTNGAGRDLSVWYSERALTNWSAGLTLFSKLAQAAHSPLPDAQATFSRPTQGNVLAIGSVTNMPASWLGKSPIRLRDNGIEWQLATRHGQQKPWMGATHSPASAFLMESHTPYQGHVAVTFLTTNPQNLKSAAWVLTSAASWNTLQGDLAWKNTQGIYQSTMVGSHFMYGNRHSGWFWIFLFSVRPWLWVFTGMAAVLFATLTVWIFTVRKKAQWRAEEAL